MPDAVGNLFRANERRDRKYGPAGQLLESWGKDSVTRYSYDAEGNLTKKVQPDGSTWTYEWNAAGMLSRVVRPDGKTVEFGYDALGRRIWKKYQGKTTKWIWDGNVPVDEWGELDPGVAETPAPEIIEAEDAGLRQRGVDLAKRASQGPPVAATGHDSATSPITWVLPKPEPRVVCKSSLDWRQTPERGDGFRRPASCRKRALQVHRTSASPHCSRLVRWSRSRQRARGRGERQRREPVRSAGPTQAHTHRGRVLEI